MCLPLVLEGLSRQAPACCSRPAGAGPCCHTATSPDPHSSFQLSNIILSVSVIIKQMTIAYSLCHLHIIFILHWPFLPFLPSLQVTQPFLDDPFLGRPALPTHPGNHPNTSPLLMLLSCGTFGVSPASLLFCPPLACSQGKSGLSRLISVLRVSHSPTQSPVCGSIYCGSLLGDRGVWLTDCLIAGWGPEP